MTLEEVDHLRDRGREGGGGRGGGGEEEEAVHMYIHMYVTHSRGGGEGGRGGGIIRGGTCELSDFRRGFTLLTIIQRERAFIRTHTPHLCTELCNTFTIVVIIMTS